ncbi:MAG: hypothetical protein WCS73_13195 [Lentisphaeria bacterium]
MLNMEKTLKNLMGMKVTDDFENDVICAFESDEEILVSKQRGRNEDYQAYENLEDAPIVCIKIEDNTVTEVWEA